MTQIYSVLESRYEAELVAPSDDVDCWTANVWYVSNRSRSRLASFVDVCETAARAAAYTFIARHPR